MPKYLFHGSYSSEGNKGIRKSGGTARVKAVKAYVESAGGKLESFYFALGHDDFFIIADLPNSTAVVAIALGSDSSGAIARVATTPLITAEEVDAATKMNLQYSPPGA
jgi:uncharacterized protein with GYD domain